MVNAVLTAFVLRMLHVSDLSLWVDEGATWWNATRATWTAAALAEHNHPPVWWLLTRISLHVFPADELGLRMPSVIAGMLSLILSGLLARRLCDPARVPSRGGFVGVSKGVTVWVVLLASIGPFWIAMSQEARMYSGLLAESIGLSLLYLRWLDRDRRSTLVAYGLLASFTLYTQYLAVLPILGHLVHAFVVARRTRVEPIPVRFLPFFTTVALAGASFIPWFLYFLQQPPGVSTTIVPPYGRYLHALWRMAVGPAFVPLDRARAEAGVQSVVLEQPFAIAVSALLLAVPLFFGVRALGKDRGLRSFVAATFLVPSLGILLIGVKFPLVEEKYVVFLAPILLLVAVLGAVTAAGWKKVALLASLVAVHALGLVAYHAREVPEVQESLAGGHLYGKEQWREAERYVSAKIGTQGGGEGVVLIHAPFASWTWDFYAKSGLASKRFVLPAWEKPCDLVLTPKQVLAEVPALPDAHFVALVLSHECTEDRDLYLKVVLDALEETWGVTPSFHVERFPVQWGIRVATFERR
jgi:uncharacterized membrane protein